MVPSATPSWKRTEIKFHRFVIKSKEDRENKQRLVALCPHTLKHIWGGWSDYADTSKPVVGYGAQNMVTVHSGFKPATFQSLAQNANQLHYPGPR
jgi:hypothetical protein